MKNTYTLFFLSQLFFGFSLIAQPNPIWTYDFSDRDSFETDWKTGGQVFEEPWQWTDQGQVPGINLPPFNSPTNNNGYAYFFPEQNMPVSFNAYLTNTKAIDCSDSDNVWIDFYSQFFYFNDNSVAFLEISTDSISFESIRLFDRIRPNDFSDRLKRNTINISELVANAPEVYLRFRWIGSDEFIWRIDDIGLFDGDPRPANDLSLSRNFYARTPYAAIPKAQSYQCKFLIDHGNSGSKPQTDVLVSVSVFESPGNQLVYSDTIYHDFLGVDSIVENMAFEKIFETPMQKGIYMVQYKIESSQIDQQPIDNTVSFAFEVTDSILSHEFDVNPVLPLLGDVRSQTGYSISSHFKIQESEGVFASSVSFDLVGTFDYAGSIIEVVFARWEDANNDGDIQPNERGIGVNNVGEIYNVIEYEIEGDGFEPVNIALTNIDSVELIEGSDYIITIIFPQNVTNNNSPPQVRANAFDYTATNFANAEYLDTNFYAAFEIRNADRNNDVYPFFYGRIPLINLNVQRLITSTANPFPRDVSMQIAPNPAGNFAELITDFPSHLYGNTRISVMDASGKVNIEKDISLQAGLQRTQIPVNGLSSGTYFLHIQQGAYRETLVFQVVDP